MRHISVFTCVMLAAVAVAAQDDIYLELTQPGLRKVAVAAPPLMVLPGTPADAAGTFQGTLDEDLAAAGPIALVPRHLYALVEDDPRPDVLHQRWRAIGAPSSSSKSPPIQRSPSRSS